MPRSPSVTRRPTPIRDFVPRAPVLPVAVAFGLGIAADRVWELQLTTWLALAGAWLCGWGVCRATGRGRTAAAALLLAVGAVGGARHHWHWAIVDQDDVALFARDEPQPVHLVGRIVRTPYLAAAPQALVPPSRPPDPRTITVLAAEQLLAGGVAQPVGGLVRITLDGALPEIGVADRVEVYGLLALPPPQRNPGGFDFRAYLRGEGIRSTLRVDHPECLTRLETGRSWQRWRAEVQRATETQLRGRLSSTTAPLALALLLGPRSELPEELSQAFIVTGTMHLLAISGMNIGILVLFLRGLCRLVRLPFRVSWWVTALGVVGYVVLTDARAPVQRATCLALLALLGLLFRLPPSPLNHLAAAAGVILCLNPTELFSTGAQLSFLAVLALIWSGTWRGEDVAEVDAELVDEEAWSGPWRDWAGRQLAFAVRATAAIWLFTLPLTVARFNLASSIGFVLNIPLIPWVTGTLWCGYATLLAGWVCPPLADFCAYGFDAGLHGLIWCVQAAALLPGSHLTLPSPPGWWLVGLYLGLGTLCLTTAASRAAWTARRGLLAWLVVGLAAEAWPRGVEPFRCTFLSVGHGGAILVELPEGRTLLYDAGSLQAPDRAAEAVRGVLRARGRWGLDAVVVSHADVDHFNGVPDLVRTIPVGRVYIAPSFLDFSQPSVERMCTAVVDQACPLRFIRQGDELDAGDDVRLRILHPPSGASAGADNAQSIVLEIETAGRRILLTGDLEGAGLEALMRQPDRQCDVLLAPHHGGRRANTHDLARWARPTVVVVSGGRDAVERLREIYPEPIELYETTADGAVTIEIPPDGALRTLPHLQRTVRSADRAPGR